MGFIILIITKLIGFSLTALVIHKTYQIRKFQKIKKKKQPDEDDTEPSKHDTLINNLPNNIVPIMYLYIIMAIIWTLMAPTSASIWIFILLDIIIIFFFWALS